MPKCSLLLSFLSVWYFTFYCDPRLRDIVVVKILMEGIAATADVYAGLCFSQNKHLSLSCHLLSLIWFLAYLEFYVYKEEEIDQDDVDKYEKMSPSFMDYDVSNIFRNIQNIICSFMNLWFSVIFWQLTYIFILPFLMFQEIGSAFMITFKRDIGGSCLKKNSTPARIIRQVSPDPWVKLNDEGIKC